MLLRSGASVALLGVLAAAASGQTTGADGTPSPVPAQTLQTSPIPPGPIPPEPTAPEAAPPAPASDADAKKWEFSVSTMFYIVPDDQDYVQPTLTADRGWLHLEARYNYEALDTGSLWAGYNFSGGDKLAWELTPMLGGVFGETGGVAPGYEGSLSWWKLELYSEGEYIIDANDSADNFFYNWSELTLAPVDWFRFGLVTQRTRLYESDRDIQYGALVGVTMKNVDLAAYILNPDEDEPVFAFSIEVSF